LRHYRPRNQLEKYYSIVFRLPKEYFLLLLALILNIFIYLVDGNNWYSYVFFFVLSFSIIWFYGLVLKTSYRVLRRSLGLALFSQTIFFIIGFWNFWIGLFTASAFMIIAIMGIDGTNIWRYIIPILPALILIITMREYLYSLALLVLILYDYIVYLIMSIHRIGRFKAPDIGTMFIKNLLDRRRDVEELFREYSVLERVKPRIIISEDNDLLIIYPDIHYGPFSNTGSSMFPSMINNILKNYFGNVNVVSLHGTCSHERNIPTYNDTLKFINMIVKDILSNRNKYAKIFFKGFRRIHGNKWDLLIIVFDKVSLILLSNNKGIDDPPYTLQLFIEEKARDHGINNDIILVDCHNHELEEEHDINEIKILLNNAVNIVEDLLKKGSSEVYYRVLSAETSSPGVIGSKIILLQIGKPEEYVYLIYIPGNNMEPSLRNYIRSVISRKFGISIDSIEVLTSDEHSETGVSTTMYIPVLRSESLIKTIIESTERLMKLEWRRGLWYRVLSIKVPLMNDLAWKLLELVRKSYRLSAILLILYLLTAPLISYYLLSIISMF
jgi:putative membrane protein